MKRILFYAGYISFLLALVLFVDYVLFLGYFYNLYDRQRPDEVMPAAPGVPAAIIERLGHVDVDKQSSFSRFAVAKPPGTIRIGAFGDSFTHGDEVDEESDFPRQLQKLLERSGVANAEVLNFGSAWHGFGQSYIMWDEIGRGYDLDAIILGPATFFADRDTRFNHTYGAAPYYLHSRFVLEDGELRRVDPLGATHAERFRRYVSFLTPWQYLRYDRNDPAFLAAALPEGRALGNPFYYDSRSEQAEATELQSLLLARMARAGTPIVLGVYPWLDQVRRAAAGLAAEDFCAAALDQMFGFPYQAPQGHNSPTGNVYLAHQYLALLLGREVEAPVLSTADLPAASAPVRAPMADLAAYDEVHVRLNGIAIGGFVPGTVHPASHRSGAPLSILRDRGVHALVALKSADRSLLDAAFVPNPGEPEASAPVRLIHHSAGGLRETSLGPPRRLGENLNLGVLDLPGFESRWQRPIGVSPPVLAEQLHWPLAAGTLQLLLGGQVILEGADRGDGTVVDLRPTEGEIYLLRSLPSGDAAADRGESAGVAELVLRSGADTVRLPVAQWRIELQRLDPSRACPRAWVPPLGRAELVAQDGDAGRPLRPGVPDIRIRASGDQYGGPPIMQVYVDDRPVGGAAVTAAHARDEWQTFSFSAPGSIRALAIEFANDAYDPTTGEDRNLWLDDVEVRGHGLTPEGAIFERNDGTRLPGERVLYYQDRLIFTLPTS